MSNDISYVIKVVDDFSANLKKFEFGITAADKSATNFSIGAKSVATNMKSVSKAASSAAYLGIGTYTSATQEAAKSSKFFTQNLIDLGKATGIYLGVQQIKNFALGIYDTRIKMDGLEASLSAILPKFDSTKSGFQLATEEIDYLREATNKLGVSFKDVLPAYVQLISNSPFQLKETRKIFESFAGYGRLNALSGDQQKSVMYAIQQMMGKKKIQAQEFNLQLAPVLPNTQALFTKALQRVTGNNALGVQDLYKFMGEGRLGAGLLKEVSKIIEEDYGEAIIHKSHTLGGEVARNANAFQEFQTVLSVMFNPAMRASVLATNDFLGGLRDVFKAIDDQSAFQKQSEDLQALTTLLRIAKGLLQGFGEELSLIGSIVSKSFGTVKDLISGATIAAYAVTGGDKEIARDAFSELGGRMKNRFTEPQQAQVDIYHHNTPRNTKVEMRPQNNPNLNVGNMVNYESGGYE